MPLLRRHEDWYGCLTKDCGFRQFIGSSRRPLGRHSQACHGVSAEYLYIISYVIAASQEIRRLGRRRNVAGLSDYLRVQWFEAEVETRLPHSLPLCPITGLTLRTLVRKSFALSKEGGSQSESSGLEDSGSESPGSGGRWANGSLDELFVQ